MPGYARVCARAWGRGPLYATVRGRRGAPPRVCQAHTPPDLQLRVGLTALNHHYVK